ncbi:MAG: hypothetical protein GXY36_04885 [Chloroflexi bacterium]|nr:hypothetical protein [Chloroflexota bacterium]
MAGYPSSPQHTSADTWWDDLLAGLDRADLSASDIRARYDAAAAAANNKGLQAAGTWHYAAAVRLLTAAVEIWARLEHTPGEINARNARGAVWRKLGGYASAADDHRAALALADETGHRSGAIAARAQLGAAYVGQDRPVEALAELDRALAESAASDDNWGLGHAQGFRGLAFEAQKHWQAASDAYAAALEQWYSLHAPIRQIEVVAGLARVTLAQGYTADAYRLAEQVLEYLAEHGPARLDEPLRVYLTMVHVLRVVGQRDEARDLLSAAHHLLLQQADELAPDQRETFLQAVPVNRAIREAWAREG